MKNILTKNKLLRSIFLKKRSRVIEDAFLSRHATDKKTLDIGAKTKANAVFFPNLVTANVESGKEVDIVTTSETFEGLIPDKSVDVILCLSVLEHTKHPELLVKDMHRMLKKGGKAIISVPFIMSLHDTPHDYWRFTRYGVQELFKDFTLVSIEENMNSIETIGYLYHRMFLQTKGKLFPLVNIIYFLVSKLHYACTWITDTEYGYVNKSRKEHAILANTINAVFEK